MRARAADPEREFSPRTHRVIEARRCLPDADGRVATQVGPARRQGRAPPLPRCAHLKNNCIWDERRDRCRNVSPAAGRPAGLTALQPQDEMALGAGTQRRDGPGGVERAWGRIRSDSGVGRVVRYGRRGIGRAGGRGGAAEGGRG